MNDLIRIADLMADFESCNAADPEWNSWRVDMLIARQTPVASSQIIHCEQCVHYHEMEEGFMDCIHPCGLDLPNAHEFCSHGEEKPS